MNKKKSGEQSVKLFTKKIMILLVFIIPLWANAQSRATLKGLIEDKDGLPVTGATVFIKQDRGLYSHKIASDKQGLFLFTELEAAFSYTLTISHVGFETQTLKKAKLSNGKEESVIITLLPVSSSLQDVVVVGYGTQKRSDITGSVSSVPKERMDMAANLNVAQVLQSIVPGIVVQQTTAGAASQEEIMIRGRKSILANNSPLIVVDGIPYYGQLRDINIKDLESVDVLKDASAAAIYGSRGANGVILITTKTGSKGKPVITYDGRVSGQKAINVPYFMTGSEFYEFKNIREPGKVTSSEQQIYDSGGMINWADLVLRGGMSQQHELSVTGGFDQTKYYIGANYLDIKGVTINDKYDRFTLRTNIDTKISNWLSIGTRTQISLDDRSGISPNWEDVLRTNPLTSPYDENGLLAIYPWPEYTDIGNPLSPINYKNTDKSYQLISNNYLQVDIPFIKGLNYRFNSGIRTNTTDIATYIGRDTKDGLEARGIANTSRGLQNNLVIENLINYSKGWHKHRLQFTGLYSYERNTTTDNVVDARGFPHDFLTNYSIAQANQVTPLYKYYRTDLISQMARINYAYNGKYLLTLTGRRDGFSGFGEDNKWGVFPSLALGWNIAEEQFFPFQQTIDRLKLRFSTGKNGNQAVEAYETISRLGEYNMVALNQSLPGYIPVKLGQNNLGWESSTSTNVGIDFSIANGTVTGDLNVYKIKTKALLLNRTISLVHGIGSITQNIGQTSNNGIELSLSVKAYESKLFKWVASGNLTCIKNQIVSLYGMLDKDGKEIDDVANKWFIGKPILVNYNYVWDGVWQLDEASAAASWGSLPGQAKLKDIDGNKEINAEDRQVTGQQDPKFLWGFTNSFSYKNFNVEIFLHGVHGLTRENRLLQDASASSEVRRNVLKKNWWTTDNPTNDFYSNAVNAEKMKGISAVIYENASFIRIKDISVSYTFRNSNLEKLKLNSLRTYITARNLATFTQWTASDPEINFGRGALPLQRELTAGVTIIF